MKLNTLALVVIIIIGLGLTTGGMYFWQQSHVPYIGFRVSDSKTKDPDNVPSNDQILHSELETKAIISSRATEILLAMKNNDFAQLSTYIHPQKGVRFSPYASVNINDDIVYTTDAIKNGFNDTQKYMWGIYDGSGFLIELTFQDYFKKFVYSHDFAVSQEVRYNSIIGKGNTPNNIVTAYPNGVFVEYHFSGFDPQYAGMDWESLRLVFEKNDTSWYLVGIVHDQWTI